MKGDGSRDRAKKREEGCCSSAFIVVWCIGASEGGAPSLPPSLAIALLAVSESSCGFSCRTSSDQCSSILLNRFTSTARGVFVHN